MNEIASIEPAIPQASEVAHREPPEPVSQIAAYIGMIERAARDPHVDVAKMQALLVMQQQMMERQAQADFNAAMVRLSCEMPRVKKNGRVDLGTGKGGYDFARWEDMDAVIRPLMQREGFVLSFNTSQREGGGAVVEGTLLHAGGHTKTASIPLPLDAGAGRNNLQAMGSTLSYGKRYVAEMLLNIVREGADDDGHTGGMQFIPQEAVDAFVAALKKRKIGEHDFCEAMGVKSIEEIQMKDVEKAKNAIASYKPRPPAETGP